MNSALFDTVQSAQSALDPQFKALRGATAALKQAAKLAAEERADALAMQKSLAKLELAAQEVTDPAFTQAVADFAAVTRQALDDLAFHFAHDLKEVFEQRGETVEGRPPTLVVGELVLQIDINARKAQWIYGKEALTKPIPLSINTIVKAFDQQTKSIVARKIDVNSFLTELHTAWNELLAKRSQRPSGGRINLIELYSQVVMNRQIPRFWNAPSRSTFKDYERAHFVRDLVLAHDAPGLNVDGQTLRLRLGVATKNQAESAARSIWVPQSALDGDFYASLWFE